LVEASNVYAGCSPTADAGQEALVYTSHVRTTSSNVTTSLRDSFVKSSVDMYRQKKRFKKYSAWKELLVLCPATTVMLIMLFGTSPPGFGSLREVAQRLSMLREVPHRLISEHIDAHQSQSGRSKSRIPAVAKSSLANHPCL
jgi:hypothetical protein